MVPTRVLLADSDTPFRTAAHQSLVQFGYQVVSVGQGQEALAALAQQPFDVVVVQVAMPQMDGIQVLKEIKAQKPGLPVLLLTDSRTLGYAATGVRAGAYDYLVKPVDDMSRLAQLIDRALGGRSQAETPTAPVPAPDVEAPLASPDPAPVPARSAPVATVTASVPPRSPERVRAAEPARAPDSSHAALLASPAEPNVPPPLLPRPPSDIRLMLRPLLQTMLESKGLDSVLAALAETAAKTLRGPHAALLLAHADNQLHLSASFGYADPTAAEREFASEIGEELAWKVALSGQVVWHTEAQNGSGLRLVGVPLVLHGKMLGVLLIYPVAPRAEYNETDLQNLEMISAQATLIAELLRLQAQVTSLQPQDELTGVLNREHFFQQADREFRRSWRYNQPVGLVLLDLDLTDKINQMLSRDGGDQVLRQVAGILRPMLRGVDLLGRLGEDTFAVLLILANRQNSSDVADRLRRAIAGIELSTPSGPWQVTASFGVTAYPRENCASIHDMVDLAEQAVRVSKRGGRNRVTAI